MLLLDLPDELVGHVLQACTQFKDEKGRFFGAAVPGRQDLLNFSLTCHKAHGLARPHLLSSCLIRRAKHVKTIASIIEQDPTDVRLSDIRDLALVPCISETLIEYAQVAELLGFLPNIEHLFIEIPHHSPSNISANKGLFELIHKKLEPLDINSSAIPGCPIPQWSHRLITCHLNFQAAYGGPNYLRNLEFVAFAPRLRELTLRNAHIEGFGLNGVRFYPPQHVSNLQSLSLDHCSFSLRGISQLLSTPVALRSFFFFPHSTAVDHDSGRSNILGLLAHTAASLATYQRHSLTDLSIHFEGLDKLSSYESSVPTASHISFKRLTRLTKLKIYLSPHDRLKSDTIATLFPRLPPSITHLCIEDAHRANEYVWLTGLCRDLHKPLRTSRDSQTQASNLVQAPLPNVTNLSIIFTPYHDILATPTTPRISPEQASAFAEQGHLFRHRFQPLRPYPIHFTVSRRTELSNVIPPYLWDQDRSEEVLVYDNMIPEDMWAIETETEKKRCEEMRELHKKNLERQQQLQAAHQNQLAQQQLQAAHQSQQAQQQLQAAHANVLAVQQQLAVQQKLAAQQLASSQPTQATVQHQQLLLLQQQLAAHQQTLMAQQVAVQQHLMNMQSVTSQSFTPAGATGYMTLANLEMPANASVDANTATPPPPPPPPTVQPEPVVVLPQHNHQQVYDEVLENISTSQDVPAEIPLPPEPTLDADLDFSIPSTMDVVPEAAASSSQTPAQVQPQLQNQTPETLITVQIPPGASAVQQDVEMADYQV